MLLKLRCPSLRSQPVFAILFGPFGLLAPKDFKFAWISNLLTQNVPNYGYSRNVSCALNFISTFYYTTDDLLQYFHNLLARSQGQFGRKSLQSGNQIRISKTNTIAKGKGTKHTHKTKDRVTRTPLKTVGELRCSGRVNSSCYNRVIHDQIAGEGKIITIPSIPHSLLITGFVRIVTRRVSIVDHELFIPSLQWGS